MILRSYFWKMQLQFETGL